MDIYVYRTSKEEGSIRQFNSLEECINTLIKETNNNEYVISKPPSYFRHVTENTKWLVEIYDDYRE